MIRNIVQDPFGVYNYTAEQMMMFIRCVDESSWDDPVLLSLDTSGDIFPSAKTTEGKKKFYNFALCLSSKKIKNKPVCEMLTLKVETKNVKSFLNNFICDLEKINNTTFVNLPQIFVCDYSWINIHSVLNVFLKTDIHKYLEDKFSQFIHGIKSEKTLILLDKLHVIKFLLLNCRKIEAEKYKAETFVAVFLHLLNCRTKVDIVNMWIAIVHVFGCKQKNESYQNKIEELSSQKSCNYEALLDDMKGTLQKDFAILL